MLTLTGPAGVGKTRLALTIAASDGDLFPDGASFVSLAPIVDPALVPALVASAFDVTDHDARELVPAIAERLDAQRVLLVLDNFEHVLDAAHLITELLVECPGLRVLATSRSPLHLAGEYLLPVPMLSLPERGHPRRLAELAAAEAVQLFVSRAGAACGDFTLTTENATSVGEICRNLDGLPLAIELAAARLRVLSPSALLARLQRGLPLLVGGTQDAPARLRSMADAIAWSYELLTPAQQALFRRLGVFAGGWTLDAVDAVCLADIEDFDALEGISALVDQSLIRRSVQDSDEPRFEMLHVVREFALDRLVAAGEDVAVRRAHARYYRALAERAGAARGPEQQQLHERITEELNNVRLILAWTLSETAKPADLDAALELMGDLWFYFIHHAGAPDEARLWLTRALAIEGNQHSSTRGRAVAALGAIEWRQGYYAEARLHLDQGVETLAALGELRGLADALHVAGHVRFEAREFAAAQALFERSQAAYASASDELGALPLIGDLGMVAYHQGDYRTAQRWFERCLRSCREHNVADHAADSLNRLGDLARLAGDLDRALALYTESLELWRMVRGTPGVASGLHKLAQVARRRGDADEAQRLVLESLALQQEIGNKQGIVECLVALAGLAVETAPAERAVELLSASEAALAALGAPLAPADAVDFERDRRRGRGRLPAERWASADRRGRELTLAEALALAQARPAGGPAAPPAPKLSSTTRGSLSPREAEVAGLVASGLSNRQIGAALGISEKTAANHVEHIMTKLDLRSRAQIAAWAVRQGTATPS